MVTASKKDISYTHAMFIFYYWVFLHASMKDGAFFYNLLWIFWLTSSALIKLVPNDCFLGAAGIRCCPCLVFTEKNNNVSRNVFDIEDRPVVGTFKDFYLVVKEIVNFSIFGFWNYVTENLPEFNSLKFLANLIAFSDVSLAAMFRAVPEHFIFDIYVMTDPVTKLFLRLLFGNEVYWTSLIQSWIFRTPLVQCSTFLKISDSVKNFSEHL